MEFKWTAVIYCKKEAYHYQETHTPTSSTHLSSTGTPLQGQQHARNTWPPAGQVKKKNRDKSQVSTNTASCKSVPTKLKLNIKRFQNIPLKDLRSCCGCEPCCPARSCGARACWCRTWPSCTGGPPASPGRSHAPSSALWPSARS